MTDKTYEQIVEEYSGKLYGYLKKLLTYNEDIEDIMQNVFLSFYVRMSTINPDSYASYLFRMAHNKAINHLKKEKRYVAYNEHKEADNSADENAAATESNNEKIKEAFKKLKPNELFALELQLYRKLSYMEIAVIMETTPNAVDSMLVRAKKKLRTFLQDKR